MMNDVLDFYCQSRSDLQHKGNLVSLQVQTSQFGIGLNPKHLGMSFKKKTAHNFGHIRNNPLAVIVTLLMIYQELIPSRIDVGLINLWDMFKIMCMGTVIADFNGILFKARRKTFEFI